MLVKGGYTNYGQNIGILMLETSFPRIPGDIGNALSYSFPVKYKVVKGAVPERVITEKPDMALLEPFIIGARELENEGVMAVSTSCGFLAPFQKELTRALKVPVFTSSLMQVPLVNNMLSRDRRIAILTINPEKLNEGHFLGSGWSSQEIPVIVRGVKDDSAFRSVFFGNRQEMDIELIKDELKSLAQSLLADHPETGAIILECTNMAPFSRVISETTGIPVFDINTLMNFVYSAVRPNKHI